MNVNTPYVSRLYYKGSPWPSQMLSARASNTKISFVSYKTFLSEKIHIIQIIKLYRNILQSHLTYHSLIKKKRTERLFQTRRNRRMKEGVRVSSKETNEIARGLLRSTLPSCRGESFYSLLVFSPPLLSLEYPALVKLLVHSGGK